MLMGKHDKNTNLPKKTLWLIGVVGLLMAVAVAGVIAYIIAKTPPVSNTFSPAQVTCRVQERFDSGVKEDVCVENTGNVPAYIRAYVTVNWVSAEGYVYAVPPVEATDYTMVWGADGWTRGADGFWYYTQPVPAGGLTGILLDRAQVLADGPAGYRLDVKIHASALQAEPTAVVEQVWGVVVQENTLQLN